ncbi:hypothetical protein [Nocardia sp. X0981]
MTAQSNRAYAGESPTERGRRRRLQLLEAGLDLLAGDGVEPISKRRVLAAANLNDRYFAENFASVEDLVREVHRWQLGELAAQLAAVSEAVVGDIRARTTLNVEAVLRFLTEDPRRPALLDGRRQVPGAADHREQWAQFIAAAMLSESDKAALPAKRGIRHLEIAALVIATGAIDVVTLWASGRFGDITVDELRDSFVDLILDAAGVVD